MSNTPNIPATPSQEAYAVDEDQGDVFTSNEPFDLFASWLNLAIETEPNDANAMSVASVDKDGLPDVRIVLLKDVSKGGLTFYTNTLSAKGRQLSDHAKAACCFHWKTLRRQVRFRGDVAPVSAQEADAYFASRARGARIGAWASQQSAPMESPAVLKQNVADVTAEFEGQDVPRPEHWSGYRLIPTQIEFWVNRPFRLHDRLQFTKNGNAWLRQYLNP